jgi:hypothetical protein
MELTQEGPGNHSINLSSYSLGAGKYTLYVQAAGKPVFRNHMSNAVSYTANGSFGLSVGASPSSLSLRRGQSAQVQVTVTANGSVDSAVALSCANLPAGATCVFSPGSVNPGKGTAAATLTISAAPITTASRRSLGAAYALWLPMFGFAGIFLLENGKLRRGLLVGAVAVLLLLTCSCGAGTSAASSGAGSQMTAQGSYAVTVLGTSSSGQSSATVLLHIQ